MRARVRVKDEMRFERVRGRVRRVGGEGGEDEWDLRVRVRVKED